MTRDEFLNKYWKYYLLLEKKFLNTNDYVEICKDNKDAYSNEYAYMLQAIGGELDTFFKEYCGFALTDRNSIADYEKDVTTKFPHIKTQEVEVILNKNIHKPFEHWSTAQPSQSLFWWQAYDHIKHNRVDNAKEASQNNVLYILSALFLLEMKLLDEISQSTGEPNIPNTKSELFDLPGWTYTHTQLKDLIAKCDGDTVIFDANP